MNLIKKELIEEAFEKYNNEFFKSKEYYEKFKDDDYELSKHDFEKGVEFAESQLEELAIDFAKWLFNGEAYDDPIESRRNAENSFKDFIKERNENT